MILVLSGTKEGKEIGSLLIEEGHKVGAVTVTDHGAKIVFPDKMVNFNQFTQGRFQHLCRECKVSIIIDATHPYPNSVSKWAKDFCNFHSIPYLRYLREEMELPDNPLIKPVFSWEEAAYEAARCGDVIFMTTGSYNLETFLRNKYIKGKRVVVRVLPDHKVIEKCLRLGLSPRDIVAMQGPFSKEMNRATFKMFNASVVVSKDSGRAGGTDTKISAALKLKIPIIIIKRPEMKNSEAIKVYNYQQVMDKVTQYTSI